MGAVNYSKEIYEDPDKIYETLKDEGYEVPINEPGITSDTYSCPDGDIVTNPLSTEHEYAYAKETDFPKSGGGTKAEAKEQINNSRVYETLEQSGEPNDDSFYNYPENTITKAPESELEYAYAKDTDLPRISTDKTAFPEKSGSNAVYHTLEQGQRPSTDVYNQPGGNILADLEYTYAKDTKIPRIPIDTKSEAKGDGVPATSTNDTYHTLEQEEPASNENEYSYAKNTDTPSIPLDTLQNNGHSSRAEPKPPQQQVYSTLEESGDVDN